MSERWTNEGLIHILGERINKLSFADRVQMIHKLLKLIVETLDGMEAEIKRECP